VARPRNILLIIADDVGVDRVAAYGEHPWPGRTPVIDQLAAQGVLFRNAWANPSCSPTRATILTGRYGMRTGIGTVVSLTNGAFELSDEEVTLADVLGASRRTAAVGKWHLGLEAVSGFMHPMMMGFEQHRGALANFSRRNGYYCFRKNVNGVSTLCRTYATTDTVDDALAFVGRTRGPWFLWLAFNAGCKPFHKPPPQLHSYNLPISVRSSVPLHLKATVQAMDTEIGRLLNGIDPDVLDDTVIVFVGDNGTARPATTAPFLASHAKETMYEGGINVPLIIKGPGVVAGRECAALVNTTDLFATVVELAGVAAPIPKDSTSLVPYLRDPARPSQRPWVYAEHRSPNGFGPYAVWRRAVRDARYKLIRVHVAGSKEPSDELYDLVEDPWEEFDLIATGAVSEEAARAYARLDRTLEVTLAPIPPRSGRNTARPVR